MRTIRERRIHQIEDWLGTRKLVWFGTRGTDSQALLQISQFSEVYSIVAPLHSINIAAEVCLESSKRRRVDLDQYNIDFDESREARELISQLFTSLEKPAAVAMYRPGGFFTAIYYPRSKIVDYLGQFQERQAPFEHKPWVESELRKLGIKTVPWQYFGDGERPRLEELLSKGPLVIRASRSDGGAGVALIHKSSDIDGCWPRHSDMFFAAAPYLFPNVPLNVNAVVFENGEVSLHSPSLQLIGLGGFTNRKFGYCGNDFARVRDFPEALDQLEDIASKAGRWLASMGYRGAFGVDALLHNDNVYLTEINPRFQGSSHLSSLLDRELERPDMFLEHIAAFLPDLGPAQSPDRHLRDLAREQRPVAQVVCHNCTSVVQTRNSYPAPETGPIQCMLLPDKGVEVDPEAILLRAVIEDCVTKDGLSLCEPYLSLLKSLIRRLFQSNEG